MDKHPPLLVVDVNGVGYDVEAPMSTFYRLPDVGSEISLYTHLAVREDAHLLFGFHTENERKFFRALIKVNGIGPKLALSILSGIELESFIQCVNDGDTARLTSVPGVGVKTAERMIIEMRDRMKEWDEATYKAVVNDNNAYSAALVNAVEEAVSALVALGYKTQEAAKLVHSVEEEGLTSEVLIRKALQSALKGKKG
jgi:Holliday junction DNA helicase RuvA